LLNKRYWIKNAEMSILFMLHLPYYFIPRTLVLSHYIIQVKINNKKSQNKHIKYDYLYLTFLIYNI